MRGEQSRREREMCLAAAVMDRGSLLLCMKEGGKCSWLWLYLRKRARSTLYIHTPTSFHPRTHP